MELANQSLRQVQERQIITLFPLSQLDLMRKCSTKPEKEETYDAEAYDFEDFEVLVLDSLVGVIYLLDLPLVNKLFNKRIPETSRLFLLYWRPFLEPRLGYENQVAIDMNNMNMATALALGS